MNTIVKTLDGKIEGIKSEGINKWLGVPYAKAPIDNLRFKRAQSCDYREETLSCKEFRNRPIQFTERPIIDPTIVEESEDCLYLNIWSKDDDQTQKPVFIWIYGGAYVAGESNLPLYDGSVYANENIVFVSFNYRLGPLGSMNFSLLDKQRYDSNCTLSDQIQALTWVKENIECFGGDSNNITIGGESAGGASVCSLMASPKANMLFHRAISESGLPDIENSDFMSNLRIADIEKELKKMGESLDHLDSIDIEILKKAFMTSNKNMLERYPGMQVVAYVLDDLLPMSPVDAIKKGIAKNIPLIIGTNRNEGTIFIPMKRASDSWEKIEKMFELNHKSEKLDAVKKYYAYFGSELEQMAEIAGDIQFIIGTTRFADAHSKYNHVWRYRFDFVSDMNKKTKVGACHTSEIAFALGNTAVARDLVGTSSERIESLENVMRGAWVNFIKTGNPNSETSLLWDFYDEKDNKIMIFDDESHMEADQDHDQLLSAWEDVALYKEKF